jgi:hypothetical protein
MQAIKNKNYVVKGQIEERVNVLPYEKKSSLVKRFFERLRKEFSNRDPKSLDSDEIIAYNNKMRVNRAQVESNVRMFMLSR